MQKSWWRRRESKPSAGRTAVSEGTSDAVLPLPAWLEVVVARPLRPPAGHHGRQVGRQDIRGLARDAVAPGGSKSFRTARLGCDRRHPFQRAAFLVGAQLRVETNRETGVAVARENLHYLGAGSAPDEPAHEAGPQRVNISKALARVLVLDPRGLQVELEPAVASLVLEASRQWQERGCGELHPDERPEVADQVGPERQSGLSSILRDRRADGQRGVGSVEVEVPHLEADDLTQPKPRLGCDPPDHRPDRAADSANHRSIVRRLKEPAEFLDAQVPPHPSLVRARVEGFERGQGVGDEQPPLDAPPDECPTGRENVVARPGRAGALVPKFAQIPLDPAGVDVRER